MQIPTPYLIFLGNAPDDLAAKTGQGIVDWRPEHCLGQLRLAHCRADLGIPDCTLAEAATAGARTLVIGTVSPGGDLPGEWLPVLKEALDLGMNVASGMHVALRSFDVLVEAAASQATQLFDLRHSDAAYPTGNGLPRSGRRLLTVGTDCGVGKKYTALALHRAMRAAGFNADFRATGQTGILISGSGIPIDAIVADFVSGATEALTPANQPDHWDVIEGQGSLFHPSFAGVSLGLLHGSQPDAYVVCHEPTRTTLRNVSAPVPSIDEVIEATTSLGRLTNPKIQCVGISANTQALGTSEAAEYLRELRERYRRPACDPMRDGVGDMLEQIKRDY
tara:strand:+ start:1811 stop:2815 length:1005 start_codon:yes stop_codon:yes gene_type:complete